MACGGAAYRKGSAKTAGTGFHHRHAGLQCAALEMCIRDRPTTALDVTIEAQILRLMKELRDETGMSVLIITHKDVYKRQA